MLCSQLLDLDSFYLVQDPLFLNDIFRSNVSYLANNWRSVGRPVYVVPISAWMFGMLWRRPSVYSALQRPAVVLVVTLWVLCWFYSLLFIYLLPCLLTHSWWRSCQWQGYNHNCVILLRIRRNFAQTLLPYWFRLAPYLSWFGRKCQHFSCQWLSQILITIYTFVISS